MLLCFFHSSFLQGKSCLYRLKCSASSLYSKLLEFDVCGVYAVQAPWGKGARKNAIHQKEINKKAVFISFSKGSSFEKTSCYFCRMQTPHLSVGSSLFSRWWVSKTSFFSPNTWEDMIQVDVHMFNKTVWFNHQVGS